MNVGKNQNSYLSKYKNKKMSELNPTFTKKENFKFDNVKDWEDMNYKIDDENKIINQETNHFEQEKKLQINENNQISTITDKKYDSPNNFSMNTSNFTNKFNEFTDKIELSEMTTNDQINTNLTNKRNFTITSTDCMMDTDRMNIFNEIPCDVIEEKEEEECARDPSNLKVQKKVIEINGDLIITDRSIEIKNELENLCFEDSLNESSEGFNKRPDISMEIRENKNEINRNEMNKHFTNIHSQSDDTSLNYSKRIVLKPIINKKNETENNYNSYEINPSIKRKKIRLISPYVRNNPKNESSDNIHNFNSFDLNVKNPNGLYHKQQQNPSNYDGINSSYHVFNDSNYCNNIINRNNQMENIITGLNINNKYPFTFNPINHTYKDNIPNNLISPLDYNMPQFSGSNNIPLIKNYPSPSSLNNFRNTPTFKSNKPRINSAVPMNSLLNYSKKDTNNIIDRPYSYKEYKTKFDAIPLKRGLDANFKTKECEEKNEKIQKMKEYAKNIKEMNRNSCIMLSQKENHSNICIEIKKEEEKLNFTFDNINKLTESKSPRNHLQKFSNNNSEAANSKIYNNGYSHIHSMRRLKSENDKKEDTSEKILGNNRIKVESQVKIRPISSVRLNVVNKEKEISKMFTKVYTTLHDIKKPSKNFNDSLINRTDRSNYDFSDNSTNSNISKIRPNSTRPFRKLKIKNKDKEYIDTQENTIELLLEKNKVYSEKVEKIKSYFNSKLFK